MEYAKITLRIIIFFALLILMGRMIYMYVIEGVLDEWSLIALLFLSVLTVAFAAYFKPSGTRRP